MVLIPKVNIPEGESGPWRVEKFTVNAEEAAAYNLRCAINWPRMSNMSIEPGSYTKLTCNGETVMSDTPFEMRSHRVFVERAEGRVLIAGLGLGMVTAAVALKPNVTQVTVLEISTDVIELVAPHLPHLEDKVIVLYRDAFSWNPGRMRSSNWQKDENGHYFECCWHDIWNHISADNLPEMHKLTRRYCHWTKWQGCWCRWECEQDNRRGLCY